MQFTVKVGTVFELAPIPLVRRRIRSGSGSAAASW
jgi:hypothetical protein